MITFLTSPTLASVKEKKLVGDLLPEVPLLHDSQCDLDGKKLSWTHQLCRTNILNSILC